MSAIESLARMALALRNDVSVRNIVPFDSVLSSLALLTATAHRADDFRRYRAVILEEFSAAASFRDERSWKNPSAARGCDKR